jgi:hypothetical protein
MAAVRVMSVLVLVAMMSGCGRQCSPRHGTYLWTLTTRSGDCGDARETVLTITGEPTAPNAPCVGSIVYSPDNCEVTHDQACPIPGDAGVVKIHGVVQWNREASSGNGVFDYSVASPNPGDLCQGTYDAVYTRLGSSSGS